MYYCTVSPGNVRFTRFALVSCWAVPLHRVLYSRSALTISTGNVRFTRFLYSCRACTIAQSAQVMYVLPVLHSWRAVAVLLHRVLYSGSALTLSTGNVRFTRFLYSCRACNIAQSAQVMYVLPVLHSWRAVAVPLHRVLYSGSALTLSTGNVRFTRFCTRVVHVLLHSQTG